MLIRMLLALSFVVALAVGPQELPPIPRDAELAAQYIQMNIHKVVARHNEQFVDAWTEYLDLFEIWWQLTVQNSHGVTAHGDGVYDIEVAQASGRLRKAMKELIKEYKRVLDRLEELEKATKRAPPK
jgi:hypothetical protein